MLLAELIVDARCRLKVAPIMTQERPASEKAHPKPGRRGRDFFGFGQRRLRLVELAQKIAGGRKDLQRGGKDRGVTACPRIFHRLGRNRKRSRPSARTIESSRQLRR